MPRPLPSLDTRGDDCRIVARAQRQDLLLGLDAATEARHAMQSYLKVFALIIGLMGAWLVLLPLAV